MGDLEIIDNKLQADFDKHLAVIRNYESLSDFDDQQTPLRVAIRVSNKDGYVILLLFLH